MKLDERTNLAIGHITVDGPKHVFYDQHVQAVVAACGSISGCGEQFQRIAEVLHVQAKDLGFEAIAGEAEGHLRKAWCVVQSKALALTMDDQDTLAEFITSKIRTKTRRSEQAFDLRNVLASVEAILTEPPQYSRKRNLADADLQPDLAPLEKRACTRRLEGQYLLCFPMVL